MPGSTISFLSLPHQLRLMHRGAGGLSKKVPFLHGRSAGRSWTFLTVFFYSVSANKTLSTEGQDMLHINVQQSLHSLISCYPLWKAGPQRWHVLLKRSPERHTRQQGAGGVLELSAEEAGQHKKTVGWKVDLESCA